VSDTRTVYISIGNSDDKLTQAEWSAFYRHTRQAIEGYSQVIHGSWVSRTEDPWQNACWCFEPIADHSARAGLKRVLAQIAADYRQDTIAWAEASTEFIKAADHG
jgi:hypothetical protein